MRLFVAVNLPAAERRAVWAAVRPLRDGGFPVKWVAEEALHLTIKFLGEVDEGLASAIGGALDEAVKCVRPFDLGIGGCGYFPDARRPRVVWIGIERHPALELLANDVERALSPLGFQSELKPFKPHLTIGRGRKDAKPAALAPLAATTSTVEYSSVFRVESVDLMHSTLLPAGPQYRVLNRSVLAGAE